MARAELRLINGCVMENLPPVCMYCGAAVTKFSTVRVTHGNKSLDARLPLCERDRISWLADLQTRIANGMMSAAGKGGLLGLGVAAAGHIMNASRDDRFVPVDDAHPKFIRALKEFRKQELDEFERNLVQASSKTDEPPNAFAGLGDETPVVEEAAPPLASKSPDGKKARKRSLVPWLVGGGVLAMGLLVACAGVLFLGVRYFRGKPRPPIVLETNCREVITMGFHPDGRTLAVGGRETTVKLWDPVEQKFLGDVPSPGGTVFSLEYSRDGKYLVAATSDRGGKTRVLHADTHQPAGEDLPGSRCALSSDGRTLLTMDGNIVHLFDLDTKKEVATWKSLGDHVNAFAFAPDGQTFAVAVPALRKPDPVKIYDAATGQERIRLGGRVGNVYRMAYSPRSTRLALPGEDGTVRIHDTSSGREMVKCKGPPEQVVSVAFSPDSALLASAGQDAMVRVCDAATGKQLAARRTQEGVGLCLLFSPDNRNLLAAAGSKVHVWDVAEFRPR